MQDLQRQLVDLSRFIDRQQELSLVALVVAGCVFEMPGITVSEMARRSGLSKSHTSEIVESLARKRIVIKQPDPGDKRLLRLFLSEAGTALVQAGQASARARFIEQVADLPAAVAERLATDLKTLTSVLARSRPRHDGSDR
jgi:DNA-binding MarR family transcriptional regulator